MSNNDVQTNEDFLCLLMYIVNRTFLGKDKAPPFEKKFEKELGPFPTCLTHIEKDIH